MDVHFKHMHKRRAQNTAMYYSFFIIQHIEGESIKTASGTKNILGIGDILKIKYCCYYIQFIEDD